MSGESYTRWRSQASDDDDDEGAGEAGDGRGAVTIINPQRHGGALTPLSRAAQARVAMVMVLACLVCALVGVWVGWALGSSSAHLPVQVLVPSPTIGYNHSQLLLSHLKPDAIKDFMRELYNTPRRLLKTYLVSAWRDQGLEATTTTFTVDRSKSSPEQPNTVEIIYTNDTRTLLNPPPQELDVPPYSAYSPPGVVTGPVVYGHYGRREDLIVLQSRKILLKGCILLLRHGRLHTGAKVRNAAQAGAAAVLVYPDPADVRGAAHGGLPYPKGMGLPDDGIIWDTLSTLPGDPSTPFLPSLHHVYRTGRASQPLPNIPGQAVSAVVALKLLTVMEGPRVPIGWSGGLPLTYNLGGSWDTHANVTNITVTVNNVIQREEIQNIHATLPAADESKVVMVGCHYGSLQGSSNAGLAALLALSDAVAKSYLPQGTQRKIVFSAWAASEDGMLGSTEFTQLYSWWVESSVLAYLDMDEVLKGTGSMRVTASPVLREAIREAAKQVSWPPEEGKIGTDVRNGWRLSDPVRRSDVFFHNPGSGGDYVSFVAQRGVPSAHFMAVGENWTSTFSLQHSQYVTFDAYTRLLDPTMEWTHMIASLVGATLLVLSESEVPPLVLSEVSGDLYNGWQDFLERHKDALISSGYNFTGILDAIEGEIVVLEDRLTVLDGWYNSRRYYERPYPQHYPGEDHRRQVEQRVWWFANLERGLLGPRGVGRSFTTHLMLGPDPEDPNQALHFPHAVKAITHALQKMTPWESVHQELSYILTSVSSLRQLFPGDSPNE